MSGALKSVFAAAALLASGACADTTTLSASSTPVMPVRETIAWTVGPCFGFCPVYKVEVDAAGTVAFDGERHTAVLGRKVRVGGPDAYREIESALATYRPATGATIQTSCDQQISDSSNYVVTWSRPDGTVTTLRHDKGCRSERNDALNAALQSLPQRLGIQDWAAQTTRPGVSRG